MRPTCLAFVLLVSMLGPVSPAHALKVGDGLPELHGFAEVAYAPKFKHDTANHDRYDLLEERFQLKTTYLPEYGFLRDWGAEVNFKGDLLVDEYFGGRTSFETRELNAFFSPLYWMDVKIGRQIFTWGTGDYLFINDLFPKDYISFFSGRDDEYLKKPSDGGKVSLYHDWANIDVVVIPFFEPNTVPQGDRLSFYDSTRGRISGIESERLLRERPAQFNNIETAVRVYRTVGSYEAAGYFFNGFYKSPRGFKNEMLRELFYPRLTSYGASVRGPVPGGIGYAEGAYYDSREDRGGTNRLIENASVRALAGYERDFGSDLRAGFQYQYEQTLDYKNYRRALMGGDTSYDEFRHLVTLRLTKLLFSQTLNLSVFTFYSWSDQDLYIRPVAAYDVTDRLKVTLGANLLWGRADYTEFGQMEENTNIYLRVRVSG